MNATSSRVSSKPGMNVNDSRVVCVLSMSVIDQKSGEGSNICEITVPEGDDDKVRFAVALDNSVVLT